MGELRLHLIRHAKTEKISLSGDDFDRKLVEKGNCQLILLKKYLNGMVNSDDLILCSPASRTTQTLSALKLQNKSIPVKFLDELYLGNSNSLFSAICKQNNKSNLWLIGHNDGISDLASYLTGENIYFHTSEFISLSTSITDWHHLSADSCVLVDRYLADSMELDSLIRSGKQ